MEKFTGEKKELLDKQKTLTNHLDLIKQEAPEKKPDKGLVIELLKEHADIYEKLTGKKYDIPLEKELESLGYH
jgi:hypothetical protein